MFILRSLKTAFDLICMVYAFAFAAMGFWYLFKDIVEYIKDRRKK